MLGEAISPAEGGVRLDNKMSEAPSSQTVDFRRIISLIGAAYFLGMTAIIVPISCCATCILFLMPVMLLNVRIFNILEQRLCKLVNDHWITTAYYCGLQVHEYGANLRKYVNSKCLFLANHLGLIDHFVVMTSLHHFGKISGSWMWVIYNIWKFTPLGAMWILHGNFFVNGGPNKKAALLATFRQHLKNYFSKHDYSWVIMYPEGSRFYLIRDSAAIFAKKNGLPPLQHCAYPRTGAAHAVLEVLAPARTNPYVARKGNGEPVEYIIDATLGYPKGEVVNLSNAIMRDFPRNDPNVAIHYEVIPINPEWVDEQKLQDFLYERYKKKDALLDHYYKTGKFPGPQYGEVQINGYTMLFSQVFWAISYYLHHIMWIRPLWLWLTAYFYSFF